MKFCCGLLSVWDVVRVGYCQRVVRVSYCPCRLLFVWTVGHVGCCACGLFSIWAVARVGFLCVDFSSCGLLSTWSFVCVGTYFVDFYLRSLLPVFSFVCLSFCPLGVCPVTIFIKVLMRKSLCLTGLSLEFAWFARFCHSGDHSSRHGLIQYLILWFLLDLISPLAISSFSANFSFKILYF